MRVVVKGTSTTEELADVFDCLIARLEAASIDRISNVNIYMTPIVAESAAIFVEGSSLMTEANLQMMGGRCDKEVAPYGSDRIPSQGHFVVKGEVYGVRYVSAFFRKVGVSEKFFERVLNVDAHRAKELTSAEFNFELKLSERWRLQALAELVKTASPEFEDSKALRDWFLGPFPDSRFEGSTPLEQIELGGPHVAASMARAIDIGLRRRKRGLKIPWPPPRHFDMIYLRYRKPFTSALSRGTT